MELNVYDETLQFVGIIEPNSVIWHEVYCGAGDFDIQLSALDPGVSLLKKDMFLENPNSDYLMVVEKIEPKTDSEAGDTWTVTGRSAESLLERRIIWHQTNLAGNVVEVAAQIVKENVTDPEDAKRKIDLLRMGSHTQHDGTITKQLMGEQVLDAVTELLSAQNLGFRITKEDEHLVFSILEGDNRSENSSEHDLIVFSEEMDNLLQSDYVEDWTSYKNVCLVGGEGEGTNRKYASAGDAAGLERREMFYDDSSSSTNDGEIKNEEYTKMLERSGTEQLNQAGVEKTFTGEIDNAGVFKYGADFFLGDVVTIRNRYGIVADVRITEATRNSDDNGNNVVLTFEDINKKESAEI